MYKHVIIRAWVSRHRIEYLVGNPLDYRCDAKNSSYGDSFYYDGHGQDGWSYGVTQPKSGQGHSECNPRSGPLEYGAFIPRDHGGYGWGWNQGAYGWFYDDRKDQVGCETSGTGNGHGFGSDLGDKPFRETLSRIDAAYAAGIPYCEIDLEYVADPTLQVYKYLPPAWK